MLKFLKKYLFVFAFAMICCYSVSAQIDNKAIVDTTNVPYVKSDEGAFSKLFRGKPGKAALYGLIIPGGGQIYNKKYLSAVIAASVDVGLAIYLIDQRNFYNQLNDYYLCLLNGSDCVSIFNTDDVSLIRNARNTVRQSVEYGYLYLAGGHLLTVVWAYVQAHLMDFDDSDDLSFEFKLSSPTNGNTISQFGPSLSITIPLYSKTKKLRDYRLVEP